MPRAREKRVSEKAGPETPELDRYRTPARVVPFLLLLLLPFLLLSGCQKKEASAPRGGKDYYRGPVEPAPPLQAEGKYRYGKPPERLAFGEKEVESVLARWCWPVDPNRIDCGDVGWPVKLPEATELERTKKVALRIPELTFRPVEWRVVPQKRSVYASPSPRRPRGDEVGEEQTWEEYQIRLNPRGTEVDLDPQKIPAGDWVLAVYVRWDAPIGGDATWLLPVRVR